MANIDRLKQFYPFDEAVLERVERAADLQNPRSLQKLEERYGVADGPTVVPADEGHRAFEVLTIKPRQDYDNERARVYHLPMAMPIDPNMTMRVLRMFEADPERQVVLVGNPSAAGQHYGKLRWQDLGKVWRGDLTPVVDPLLSYLSRVGITNTEELGFSYGADTAAASSARAADHDIAVEQGVWMESAAGINRGPGLIGGLRLAIDFTAAGDELENYVRACDSPPLNEARQLADVGMPRYLLGLARASNLAIGNSLAHAGFEQRAAAGLAAQPGMRTTIAWGTASELTTNKSMIAITGRLREHFGNDRVHSMALEGMHHAGGDDIDLHAAVVLQALRT